MKTKLKAPKILYSGWTIESDNGMRSFDPQDMILHLEPEQKMSSIQGTVLKERLHKTALNASVLDYFIEHQDKIPENWKEKTSNGLTNFIYFWGTVYRDSDDSLYVRCLGWYGGKWDWHCSWVDGGWDDRSPAVLRASALNSDTKASSNTLSLEDRIKAIEDALDYHQLGRNI